MKRFKNAVIAVILACGFVVASATPAHAADGYVYVVVNNRACGTVGVEVRGIQIQVPQSGFSLNWDRGDNIVYPRVRLGVRNTLNMNLECRKKTWLGWTTVGYRQLTAYITPTRHGQTFWVG